MTLLDDGEPPELEPDEPPETDDDDPRIARGADALGIPYDEAAQAWEEIHTADAADTLEHDYHEAKSAGVPLRDDLDHATALKHAVGELRAREAASVGLLDLDGFLLEPEADHDWLVPGLLERGDRVIVTGGEGGGKSTLLRQIGVQVASGIHPFTLEPIGARRVLYVDLENGRRHTRRQLRPLRISAGDRLVPGFFVPVVWPSGLDLLSREDQDRLRSVVDALGADLLIIGPSYKLAGGDPTSEEVARKVTQHLDVMRERHEFALILEAHQPYPASGATRRVERPYGASLWSRWPEFGLHLSGDPEAVDCDLRHWRGDRDERDWPKALSKGGVWPWMALHDSRRVAFARILDELRHAGRRLSNRELASAIGVAHTTIGRAIEDNRAEFDRYVRDLETPI